MRIDTTKSNIILSPRSKLLDIVSQFTNKKVSRPPWNALWINQNVTESFRYFSHTVKAFPGAQMWVFVIPNAEELSGERNDDLVKALRIARHRLASYVLGYRSLKSVPSDVVTLAHVKAFN
jgi:hypothetical protein